MASRLGCPDDPKIHPERGREYDQLIGAENHLPFPDYPNSARESVLLGFAANPQHAFARSLVSRDDFSRNVGVIVGTYNLPSPLIPGAVGWYDLHILGPPLVSAA
jgi:hypothetical protein